MNAPDKIYACINTPPINMSCSEVPFQNKDNNFEYIRKEYLLNFLEERRRGYEEKLKNKDLSQHWSLQMLGYKSELDSLISSLKDM